MAVSFDLFGTLVVADRPEDPVGAVTRALREREVPVPAGFADAYRRPHVDAPEGAEVPLPAHVSHALTSLGVEASDDTVRRAVVAAFDPTVEARPGAEAAVRAAADHGPVGVCSNCSVPELARRALVRADLHGTFDAVVTSLGCGWRKPDRRAFAALADPLDVPLASVVHVGDDPRTDAGIAAYGGRVYLLDDGHSRAALPDSVDPDRVHRVDSLAALTSEAPWG